MLRAPLKHGPQIGHQRLGPLMGREMAPLGVNTLKHHGAQGSSPRPRRQNQVLWEIRQSQRHARHVAEPALHPRHLGVLRLVVDADAGRRARRRELVHAHPGQHLVVGPGVPVRPVVQLLVHPGQEGDGVGERDANGGRARALLRVVPEALCLEPPGALEKRGLDVRVRRELVPQIQEGRSQEGGGVLRADKVDVGGEAGRWVLQADEARDDVAPVSALGDYCVC